MQLYYSPNSIAVAAAIALNEAGLKYEAIKVDFSNNEQTKPSYKKINSKGRVPALITKHGILTETGALLEYIAALAPEKGLLPTDPFLAAKVREIAQYLASTIHVNHAHKFRGHRWTDQKTSWEDMAAKVPETMTASCEFIENQVDEPLLFGDSLTIADCHFYAIARWLAGDGVDLLKFPKISKFIETMEKRKSVQTAIANNIIVN